MKDSSSLYGVSEHILGLKWYSDQDRSKIDPFKTEHDPFLLTGNSIGKVIFILVMLNTR